MFPYMKNFRYGQKKYESFSETDFSPPKKKSPIALAAERALVELPEEFKESVPELMLRVHPDWLYPHHLKPLYDAFDKIQNGERVRILLSVPPRHSKTESILFGLIRFLLTHPEKEVMYLSYAIDFSEQKSKLAKSYVLKLGSKIRHDSKALGAWTIEGVDSTFRASGLVGGQISGQGADILVIDDPHKGRVEAEQTVLRDKIYDAFVTDAMGRLSPNASVIVVHTRFHPDDLIGRIINNPDLGFTYINLPALDEQDNPVWPERWSKEELELKRKANEYAWASLYMGAPRPRGASLFNDIEKSNFYRTLPPVRLRYGVGYDLAYTAKTYADWSVAIVMATDGTNCYVVNVIRRQCDATTFANILADLRTEYPSPIPFLSFISGPEKGSVSLLNSRGLKLSFLQAKTDKYDRAQSVSAAWNLGKIYLPESAPWLDDFMTEIKHFTGVNDPRDDQVDALAGAYAALRSTPPRRDFSNFF